jgi:hypothetical protein
MLNSMKYMRLIEFLTHLIDEMHVFKNIFVFKHDIHVFHR